jgi:hypothetical protein
LPFAIIPLIKLTNARPIMGEHASSTRVRVAAGACAVLVVAANGVLLESTIAELRHSAPWLCYVLAIAGVGALGLLVALCAAKLRCEREPVVEAKTPETEALPDKGPAWSG